MLRAVSRKRGCLRRFAQNGFGKTIEMLPRPELFKRWAVVLLNSYAKGRASRPRIDTLALLSRVSRWQDQAFSPGVTDAEKVAGQTAMDTALREAFDDRAPGGALLRSSIMFLPEQRKMSPDQAEAWAVTFGWKPLAGWADPAGFDPTKEVAWSLPMAAAWIRWRDIDEVRRRWSAYIEPSTQWVDVSDKRDGSRHAVWPINDRGYYEIEDFDERENDPLTSTKAEMLLALSSGRLVAGGYRDCGFVEIPAAEWTVLNVVGICGTDEAYWIRNGIHKVMTPDGERLAYDAVRVWSEQVLAEFPPRGQEGGKERYLTGGPGRPSAIQFVEAEADRRRQSGEASPTLDREAICLHEWCKREHPRIAAPTAKTIQGRIRVAHNAWKSARSDPIPHN
jgi:hypothetical protein